MQRLQPGAVAAFFLFAAGCSCGEETLPCRVEPRAGARYLVCPDGTETPLPGERPATPSGAVTGAAHLFGRHVAGVRVRASAGGAAATSFTDDEGRFRVEGVPPGHRSLDFEAPGYVSDSRPALVLPGTLELPDPVTLWVGRLVRAGGFAIEPLSGGRQFLASEWRGELSLWDGKEGTSVVLHPSCAWYAVVADRFVFFAGLDDPTKQPALYRYDRVGGERLRIFEEAINWEVAPGGTAVAALVPTDGPSRFQVWEAATGRVATPAEEVLGFRFGPEGRRLLFRADAATVLWDVAAVAGTVVGGWSGTLDFGPTDDLVLLDTQVVDVVRERSWSFPPGGPLVLLGDGRFVVQDRSPSLEVLDLQTGVREEVPYDGPWTADGAGGLAFVRTVDGSPTLFRRDLATGATVELAAGEAVFGLAPVAGGRLLFQRLFAGLPTAELWDPVRGVVTLESFTGPGAWAGTVSPDGACVLHGNGGRLSRYDLASGADVTIASDVSDFPTWQGHPWWGPGGRFALAAGGVLSIWDPAVGLRPVGPGPGPSFAFLPDGTALAVRHFTGAAGELVRWDPAAAEPSLLAEGVTRLAVDAGGRGYGFHSIGRPELPPAVFHRLDLGSGASLPLEADVDAVIFGDGFLAYTAVPTEDGGPRAAGLYLVSAEALQQLETPPEAR